MVKTLSRLVHCLVHPMSMVKLHFMKENATLPKCKQISVFVVQTLVSTEFLKTYIKVKISSEKKMNSTTRGADLEAERERLPNVW